MQITVNESQAGSGAAPPCSIPDVEAFLCLAMAVRGRKAAISCQLSVFSLNQKRRSKAQPFDVNAVMLQGQWGADLSPPSPLSHGERGRKPGDRERFTVPLVPWEGGKGRN